MMPVWILSALRTGAQALVGYAVAQLAARGVSVPLETQMWVVQVVLVGGGIAAWTAGVRWLETRQGVWPRRVARALMLGLATPPVYPRPGERLVMFR